MTSIETKVKKAVGDRDEKPKSGERNETSNAWWGGVQSVCCAYTPGRPTVAVMKFRGGGGPSGVTLDHSNITETERRSTDDSLGSQNYSNYVLLKQLRIPNPPFTEALSRLSDCASSSGSEQVEERHQTWLQSQSSHIIAVICKTLFSISSHISFVKSIWTCFIKWQCSMKMSFLS